MVGKRVRLLLVEGLWLVVFKSFGSQKQVLLRNFTP